MRSSHNHDAGEVSVGSTHCTIRLPHQRQTIVATILHRRLDQHGHPVRLVLDRLVHGRWTSTIGTWRCHGAVTTELSTDPTSAP